MSKSPQKDETKPIKAKKAVTFTPWQITKFVSTVVVTAVLTVFATLYINGAINQTIDTQVNEQVTTQFELLKTKE